MTSNRTLFDHSVSILKLEIYDLKNEIKAFYEKSSDVSMYSIRHIEFQKEFLQKKEDLIKTLKLDYQVQ